MCCEYRWTVGSFVEIAVGPSLAQFCTSSIEFFRNNSPIFFNSSTNRELNIMTVLWILDLFIRIKVPYLIRPSALPCGIYTMRPLGDPSLLFSFLDLFPSSTSVYASFVRLISLFEMDNCMVLSELASLVLILDPTQGRMHVLRKMRRPCWSCTTIIFTFLDMNLYVSSHVLVLVR